MIRTTLTVAIVILLTPMILLGQAAALHSETDNLRPRDLTPASALVTRYGVTPKSEFESTSDYLRRASQTVDSRLVAVELVNGNSLCKQYEIEYNADRHNFILRIGTIWNPLRISCSIGPITTYSGSTIAGGQRQVSKATERSIFIAPVFFPKSGIAEWSATPSAARQLKPHLGVAAVFTVEADPALGVVWRESSQIKPTFDKPVDIQLHGTYIRAGTDLNVWVFDRRTGEVIRKFHPIDFSGR